MRRVQRKSVFWCKTEFDLGHMIVKQARAVAVLLRLPRWTFCCTVCIWGNLNFLVKWTWAYAAYVRLLLHVSLACWGSPALWTRLILQEIAKENHFKGWTAGAGDPCSGDIQVERSSARECNPANSVYKSADRNPWTGVTRDSAGRVVCIELENLGLQGPVANIIQLSGLQDLAFLDLNNNQLSGNVAAVQISKDSLRCNC